MGGLTVFQDGVKNMIEKGFKKISPFFIPYAITNMGGALVGIETGFMGPNYSISTACATANYAFVAAANHIRSGDADLIVVGGSEAPIIPVGVGGFVACRALSSRTDEPQRASRPWDQGRDGFVMGEGAGVLVFESLAHAQARGATPIAEYLGGAITCDAYHMTDPRADGLGVSSCITLALKDAGVERDAVNYINAHATSTLVGDIAEVKAVKKVFANTKGIAMNGTKSMIGHGLGAAGGLEAIAVIKAITTGWVHPTINQEDQIDEVADINTVPNVKQEHKVGGEREGCGWGRADHPATARPTPPPSPPPPPPGQCWHLQLVRLWRPQLGRRVCAVQGVRAWTAVFAWAARRAPARRGGRAAPPPRERMGESERECDLRVQSWCAKRWRGGGGSGSERRRRSLCRSRGPVAPPPHARRVPRAGGATGPPPWTPARTFSPCQFRSLSSRSSRAAWRRPPF